MTDIQICRCCLSENSTCTYAIYDGSTYLEAVLGGDDLRTALLSCAPELHLEPDDGLPDVICEQCMFSLRDALAFRRRCEASELELERRLAETERVIEEALHLVNLIDSKEQQHEKDTAGTATAAELGSSELVLMDELLQLEKNNVERALYTDMSPLNYDSSTTNTEDSRASSTDSACTSCRQHDQNAPKSLHPCSECEKKCTSNFQLKLHMISEHKLGDEVGLYECSLCHKTFASRHSLTYHQRSVHSDEHPFECTHCQRRFILHTQLRRHMRMHTSDSKPRNLQCLECGKRWPTKSDLRTHMRSHLKMQDRPYKCHQCEKAFLTRGHLTAHVLVHSGEKPFACPICEKVYQCVGNLNKHMARKHDYERGTAARSRTASLDIAEM